MNAAAFDWAGLPRELGYGLLLAGTGKPHLTGLAQMALADARTAALGLDLLLAAWEAGPLDGGLAKVLLDLDHKTGFLKRPVRAVVSAVAGNWRAADAPTAQSLAGLASARKHQELKALLNQGLHAEPANLFWRQHLLDLHYLLADWEQVAALAQAPWPGQAGTFSAIKARIAGDMHYQAGQWEEARKAYARAKTLRPGLVRLGQCCLAVGDLGGAQAAWSRALDQAPWNANLLLRLADRMTGLDRPGDPPQGRVAVCLYTKDKAPELEATLGALAASRLGGARLVVLDNASRDCTREVLAAWQERLAGAMSAISLPVNIGAPAARNWLMHSREVADSDFVAYLDDDALAPPDWLRYFGRAIGAYPLAGVWGCKVADLAAPGRLQNVDIHLAQADGEETPALATPGLQDLDFGQFDYLRPCLSVTGCCHLFRTKELLAAGDFDIRYSPTQYDDLDHDLGLAWAGKPPVYQGHLKVLHARASGALLNQDRAATANSQANLNKLAGKYPKEKQEELARRDYAAMLADLLAKRKMIREG